MFIILLTTLANAQPVTRPDTDPQNSGGTVTETTTTVGDWTVTTSERKDRNGKTIDIQIVEETKDHRRKVKNIFFDTHGDTSFVSYGILNKDGNPTYRETR